MDKEEKIHREEFTVDGAEALSKVKELLREGNIRRLIIKNDKTRRLLRYPSP
jgi:CBS domain-containing protein